MARPKPTIMLTSKSLINKYMENQIISCEGVFIVTYKDKPFSMRQVNLNVDEIHKYKKTTFVNRGHALVLCEKLIELYGNHFDVLELL